MEQLSHVRDEYSVSECIIQSPRTAARRLAAARPKVEKNLIS
jgi:hypothetical protein